MKVIIILIELQLNITTAIFKLYLYKVIKNGHQLSEYDSCSKGECLNN